MSVCTAMATVSCTRAANGDLIATLDVTNVLVAVANCRAAEGPYDSPSCSALRAAAFYTIAAL